MKKWFFRYCMRRDGVKCQHRESSSWPNGSLLIVRVLNAATAITEGSPHGKLANVVDIRGLLVATATRQMPRRGETTLYCWYAP